MSAIRASTLIIACITLIASLWFLLPPDLEIVRKVPAYFATISMTAMAAAMLISTRPKWLEPLVGGMDRAYLWHKWLGIGGLLGACFHWMLVPGPAGTGMDPFMADFGEEVGQLAMSGLLVLGGVSMVKSIPYRIWFYTHKLMGPIFLISVYHTFFSDVPFEVASLTGIALTLISIVGVTSWVYKTFFMKRHYREYRISKLEKMDDAIEVIMKPVDAAIDYQAGQFAYLDFGLDRIEHFHPFTITSSPDQQQLSFVIRALGRHTSELQSRLSKGLLVKVDGGYGQLHARKSQNKPQVWIAGGIGITPFLSWVRACRNNSQKIHLFYVGRGRLYKLMVKKLSMLIHSDTISLHVQANEADLLTADKIQQQLDAPLEKHQFFACGPAPMINSLKSQLAAKGMQRDQWHNENFVMR